jgi:hypothetical protein
MSHLINIFVEPGKTFAALKDKPSFLVPLTLMVVLSAIVALLYFNTVDSDWFVDRQLAMSGQEMTASQIEKGKQMMPSAPVMGVFGATFGALAIVLIYVVMALYYALAGKICGAQVSFKQGLSLVAWSAMPGLLGVIVTIVGVLIMEPQTPLESLALTHVDPLLVQLPADHAWSFFAKNLDLLSIWSIALAAIGWRTWNRSGWAQAVTVAIIPTLIMFSATAAWAMLKS